MNTITWKEMRFLRVPLTAEEIQARGEQLAQAVSESDRIAAEHDKSKKAMKEEESTAEGQVRRLATIVRDRVEERSVQVEMRVNLGLGMVEEIRTDTGEVVTTRSVTHDDKLRAQTEAQTSLLPESPKEP